MYLLCLKNLPSILNSRRRLLRARKKSRGRAWGEKEKRLPLPFACSPRAARKKNNNNLAFQSFHRRSSKFPAEHLPLLLEWFTPFFIAIILLNSFCTLFWVSSFYLSVNIVVLYQFTVTCIESWSVRSPERKKWLKIAITSMFLRRRRRCRARKEWICERRCQVSVSGVVYMYFRDCFALKPFRDNSLCSVCILPQPAFYS